MLDHKMRLERIIVNKLTCDKSIRGNGDCGFCSLAVMLDHTGVSYTCGIDWDRSSLYEEAVESYIKEYGKTALMELLL